MLNHRPRWLVGWLVGFCPEGNFLNRRCIWPIVHVSRRPAFRAPTDMDILDGRRHRASARRCSSRWLALCRRGWELARQPARAQSRAGLAPSRCTVLATPADAAPFHFSLLGERE